MDSLREGLGWKATGLKAAALHTDDFRLAAIQTYLNLGFSPMIAGENHRARWNTVYT